MPAKANSAAPDTTAKADFPVVTPDAIRHAFETGKYPYPDKLGRKDYEDEKAALQAELLKVQLWANH